MATSYATLNRDLRVAGFIPREMMPWLVVGLAAIVVSFAGVPWLKAFPTDWTFPQNAAMATMNVWLDWIVEGLEPITRAVSVALEWPMLVLRDTLQWLPWPVTVLGVIYLGWRVAGRAVAWFCVAAMLYIALSGYWQQAMNTMALVGVAVPLSLLLGLSIGIAAERTRIGRRIVPPTLDLMQTMPTFAYLIPLLVLFGFGPVVGLIASAIYACPPMVRNVALGLQRVPDDILEAAKISGASRFQRLFWVELPSAMAQIKVGINQTIMAALSMVIIASVIGGFDDIGWEVLSTMRKARFGESLLAGLVIVLLAVVIDRISSAYASQNFASTPRRLQARSSYLFGVTLLALCVLLKIADLDAPIEDPDWTRNIAAWMNARLDAVVVSSGDALTALKNTIFFYYLLPLRIGFSQAILPLTWGFDFTTSMRLGYLTGMGCLSLALVSWLGWRVGLAVAGIAYVLYFGLTGAPWSILVAAAVLLSWQLGGARVGVFTLCALAFIVVTGMWAPAMLSVYLCGAAAALSFFLGSILGVWAASSDKVSALIRPVADTFQTIPLFVFLIPVLMFFQVGEFTALLAIIAYAFVPAIRYTESGLRQVSAQLIEVARAQGCTPLQIFWQVKLPLAVPSILVGLNQTIMFSFAMLVIAALVGTTGLGQQIYLALSAADTISGMIAGLSMAFLAMIADRLMQAWAGKQTGARPPA